MALRPGGAQRPAPRSVSSRRHGAPAPPSPSMRAARRSRTAWLRFRAAPVDRQHPAGLDTARRRPAQPGSSCIGAQNCLRAAIDPTAYAESAAQRAPVARSAGLRPVRAALSPPCRPPISARSVRFGPQPGPGRSMSPPLQTTGSRSSCPAAACADTPRDPRHPHPGPPLSSRHHRRAGDP